MTDRDRRFKIGDRVVFRDEFGKQKVGEVVSLEPAGKSSNGVGINLDIGYGAYIRQESDVQKEVKKKGASQ